MSLQWCHNEHNGISNHQPPNYLLNRLFRQKSKKPQSLASLVFVRGIHRWPVNSPHKGPVTRKMFPFDDVIMWNIFHKIGMRFSHYALFWCGYVVSFCGFMWFFIHIGAVFMYIVTWVMFMCFFFEYVLLSVLQVMKNPASWSDLYAPVQCCCNSWMISVLRQMTSQTNWYSHQHSDGLWQVKLPVGFWQTYLANHMKPVSPNVKFWKSLAGCKPRISPEIVSF